METVNIIKKVCLIRIIVSSGNEKYLDSFKWNDSEERSFFCGKDGWWVFNRFPTASSKSNIIPNLIMTSYLGSTLHLTKKITKNVRNVIVPFVMKSSIEVDYISYYLCDKFIIPLLDRNSGHPFVIGSFELL